MFEKNACCVSRIAVLDPDLGVCVQGGQQYAPTSSGAQATEQYQRSSVVPPGSSKRTITRTVVRTTGSRPH